MIPPEFLAMYLIANAVGLAFLAAAVWSPRVTRWGVVLVFIWAFLTNTWTVLTTPSAYLGYGTLTPSALYRDFIYGWFASHIRLMVLPIAAGELVIAATIAGPPRRRWIGVTGALIFLAAIAPLGVGSGFPFSMTFGAAILVMYVRMNRDATARRGLDDVASPLEQFIPVPDVRERHEVVVRAPAALALDAAERFDMHSVWLISTIFRLRSWFMRAVSPPRRWSQGLMNEMRTIGWGELSRTPGRSVVMGAVTRPWMGNVSFQALPASQFREFSEPDLVKIAWTIEAIPRNDGSVTLRTETRAAATDAEARRKFLRYWMIARFGIVAIRWLMLPAVRRDAERIARLRVNPRAAA